MKRIGVTGHRSIPDEVLGHVEEGLRALLGSHEGPLEALSSLAEGADQLFAAIALECGADLTVVIPSGDYEEGFEGAEALERFRGLKGRATQEVRMDFARSTDEAYYAARHLHRRLLRPPRRRLGRPARPGARRHRRDRRLRAHARQARHRDLARGRDPGLRPRPARRGGSQLLCRLNCWAVSTTELFQLLCRASQSVCCGDTYRSVS